MVGCEMYHCTIHANLIALHILNIPHIHMKVLLASNNEGKVERFRSLLSYTSMDVVVCTPSDVGIEEIAVEENGITLDENAERKCRAYVGKVDMPIFSNDTGFYVEGEGLVDAPKRKALGGMREDDLTQSEITERLIQFWKGVATKYGGSVDAAWVEAFVAIYPDGHVQRADSRRDVTLTNQEFGVAHPQLPVHALYYSKATNRPSILHTEEEYLLEMRPVIHALVMVLTRTCM